MFFLAFLSVGIGCFRRNEGSHTDLSFLHALACLRSRSQCTWEKEKKISKCCCHQVELQDPGTICRVVFLVQTDWTPWFCAPSSKWDQWLLASSVSNLSCCVFDFNTRLYRKPVISALICFPTNYAFQNMHWFPNSRGWRDGEPVVEELSCSESLPQGPCKQLALQMPDIVQTCDEVHRVSLV